MAPSFLEASACSSSSAEAPVSRAPMIWPPSNAISTTTRSSGIGHQLRQDAVDRVRVQERHFEAEQAPARLLVHELDSPGRQLVDSGSHVVDLVGDVVHARPALRQELADRRLLAQRGQQLDTSLAHLERRGLDALVGDGLTVLETRAEQLLVRRHGLVEILDGDPEVVDPAGLHAGDATWSVSRYPPQRLCDRRLTGRPGKAGTSSRSASQASALTPLGRRLFGQRHDLDGADGLAGARLGLDVHKQRVELLPIKRLLLEQRVRDAVERAPMLAQQPLSLFVGGVGELALLLVA